MAAGYVTKKVELLMVIIVFAGSVFVWAQLGGGAVDAMAVQEERANAAVEAQVFASTIQIELFDGRWMEGELQHVRSTQGLGTVVEYGGSLYILTHNHWTIRAADLLWTEFRNGANERLLVLSGASFYSLVRYQDKATMVLNMPEGLAGVSAAELGNGSALGFGEAVWMATHDLEPESGFRLEPGWVEHVDGSAVPGRLELRGGKTAVTASDSGGGVWANGQVVGILWAIEVAQTTFDWGIKWERPTGSIVAGVQPLPGAVGLTRPDLMFDSAGDADVERGMVE